MGNQSFTTNFENQGFGKNMNDFKEGKEYGRGRGGKNNLRPTYQVYGR